jgi:uncharacterized damage-inducible protein DinB
MSTATLNPASNATALTTEQFFNHWMGHRNLTRKTIEKYPEDQLFTFSVGGMRPFGELALEILGMGVPSLIGVVTGEWQKAEDIHLKGITTKAQLLERWDEATAELARLWKQVTPERLQQEDVAFGQWPGTMYWLLLYVIDNEIHHRAQGFVYMRALNIEPPFFWER